MLRLRYGHHAKAAEAGDTRAVHSQRRGLESRGKAAGTINSNNELIGGGFLCVGCIEKRLGRRLTIDDIKPICIPLALGSPWNTERLRLRMLYRTQEEEDVAKIREPTKWRADFAPGGFGLATTIAAAKVETRGL